MPWTNFHSHTNYCDGHNKPQDYIIEAINQGMAAYGFSSHAPLPFECDWTIPQNKINGYLQDIQEIIRAYSQKIQVYLGLEVDFIPGVTSPDHENIKKLNLDYTIGSVHFVDSFNNGERWCIDWTLEYFMKGLKEIFNGNVKKAILRFFELSKQMLFECRPNIIGHFDKISMHNQKINLFNEDESWYVDEIVEILDLIKKRDVIVEINTRGYYKGGKNLYPHQRFFEQIKKKQIPVTINSDCHLPTELTKGYEYAADCLLHNGIDEIWSLYDGKWKPFKLDKVKGIVL